MQDVDLPFYGFGDLSSPEQPDFKMQRRELHKNEIPPNGKYRKHGFIPAGSSATRL